MRVSLRNPQICFEDYGEFAMGGYSILNAKRIKRAD